LVWAKKTEGQRLVKRNLTRVRHRWSCRSQYDHCCNARSCSRLGVPGSPYPGERLLACNEKARAFWPAVDTVVATALWAVDYWLDSFLTARRAVATVTSDRCKRFRLGKANLPSSAPSPHELDFHGHIPIFAHSFHYSAVRDQRILLAKFV
jgi:hypothetical protein